MQSMLILFMNLKNGRIYENLIWVIKKAGLLYSEARKRSILLSDEFGSKRYPKPTSKPLKQRN